MLIRQVVVTLVLISLLASCQQDTCNATKPVNPALTFLGKTSGVGLDSGLTYFVGSPFVLSAGFGSNI